MLYKITIGPQTVCVSLFYVSSNAEIMGRLDYAGTDTDLLKSSTHEQPYACIEQSQASLSLQSEYKRYIS